MTTPMLEVQDLPPAPTFTKWERMAAAQRARTCPQIKPPEQLLLSRQRIREPRSSVLIVRSEGRSPRLRLT